MSFASNQRRGTRQLVNVLVERVPDLLIALRPKVSANLHAFQIQIGLMQHCMPSNAKTFLTDTVIRKHMKRARAAETVQSCTQPSARRHSRIVRWIEPDVNAVAVGVQAVRSRPGDPIRATWISLFSSAWGVNWANEAKCRVIIKGSKDCWWSCAPDMSDAKSSLAAGGQACKT